MTIEKIANALAYITTAFRLSDGTITAAMWREGFAEAVRHKQEPTADERRAAEELFGQLSEIEWD